LSAERESSGGLVRGLNAWDATLLMMGSVIGGGIFLTPGDVAKALPVPGWILAVWVAGGILTLAGSLVYAELGAMLPETGGTYLYLREAYGALPGFLYAWVYYFVYNAGGVAAIATGFAKYAGAFFPALAMNREVFRVLGQPISSGQLLAAGTVLFLSATHYVGVKEGARLQGVFTALIVLVMLGMILGGAVSSAPVPAHLGEPAPAGQALEGVKSGAPPAITLAAFGVAMVAVLWSFDGWNQIAAVAGEVKRPQRNVPLALVLGTGIVTALYVGMNAIYLKAIPALELAGVERPAEVAALRLFGAGATWVIVGAILFAGFGCTSANIAPGARVSYALAADGLFPRPFARVHPRFRTPSFGLVVQAVWAALLCLSGRYDQLYTYSMFIGVLAFAAAGVALFVFRRTRPDAPRPYRCWGYPVVPALFVVGSLLFLANTLVSQPRESLAGLAILALGVPVYFGMRRAQARRRMLSAR